MPKPPSRSHLLARWQDLRLWQQWVLATVIAQIISLGVLIAAHTILQLTASPNLYGILLLAGVLQGSILGLAQWLVLRRYIRNVGGWLIATIVGALLAWGVGSLVDVLMTLFIALSPKVAGAKTIALLEGVFLLGAGVGTIIGFTQWIVLERHIRQSFLWIFANTFAWAFGLVIAFISVGMTQLNRFSRETIIAWIATGTAMGIVIGSITGITLIWLLTSRQGHRS
jgi:hypothetical protein